MSLLCVVDSRQPRRHLRSTFTKAQFHPRRRLGGHSKANEWLEEKRILAHERRNNGRPVWLIAAINAIFNHEYTKGGLDVGKTKYGWARWHKEESKVCGVTDTKQLSQWKQAITTHHRRRLAWSPKATSQQREWSAKPHPRSAWSLQVTETSHSLKNAWSSDGRE